MSCIKFPGSDKEKLPISTTDSQKALDSNTVYNQLIVYANEVFGNAKWSHSVTNQTLDFVEYAAGKYQVGCVSFIKVQLEDGTFHEDFGYCSADGSTKGIAIYTARTVAHVNALKKTLSCFGGEILNKIKSMNQHINGESLSLNTKSPVFLEKSTIKDTQVKQNGEITLPADAEWSQEILSPRMVENIKVYKNLKESSASKAVVMPADTGNSKSDTSANLVIPLLKASSSGIKAALTEEELRQERKRKQREKQEEYKRLHRDKCKQDSAQPNPRF